MGLGGIVMSTQAQSIKPFPFNLSRASSADVLQWVQAPRWSSASTVSAGKASTYTHTLDSAIYYEDLSGPRFKIKQTAVWGYDAQARIRRILVYDSLPSGGRVLSYSILVQYGLGDDGNDESITFNRYENGVAIPDYRVDRTYDSDDQLEVVTIFNLEENFVEGRGVYGYTTGYDSIMVYAPELTSTPSIPVALIRRIDSANDPNTPGATLRITEIESEYNQVLFERRPYIREQAFYSPQDTLVGLTRGDAPQRGSALFRPRETYVYSYEGSPNITSYDLTPSRSLNITYDPGIAYTTVAPYEITPSSFPAQGYGQDYYDPEDAVLSFNVEANNAADLSACRFFYSTGVTGVESTPQSVSSRNAFQFYPNPAEDRVHIVIDQPVRNYQITDVQGRIIRKAPWNGKAISVSSLPDGIYILELETQQSQFLRQRIWVR